MGGIYTYQNKKRNFLYHPGKGTFGNIISMKSHMDVPYTPGYPYSKFQVSELNYIGLGLS